MAESNSAASGGAGTGGFDQDAINKAVGAAIAAAMPSLAAAVGEANKPLFEQLAKLQPAGSAQGAGAAGAGSAGAAGAGDKAKSLTAEDVTRIVGEQLKGFAQTSQQAAERKSFVETKLKDLPAAYQHLLGNDPAKWPAEEQQIRGQYQADFKTSGAKVADVGGGNAGGASPSAGKVDTSKLSATKLIEMGLNDDQRVTTGAGAGGGAGAGAGEAAAK